MTEKPVIMVPVAAGAVIRKEGTFLLVQEKQPAAYGLWNFPAGRVDVGDTIKHTAVREAKEESGFDIELIREIDIYHDSEKSAVCHAFAARIIGGELAFPPEEMLDARWFTFTEIEKMHHEGKTRGSWIVEATRIVENNLESYT